MSKSNSPDKTPLEFWHQERRVLFTPGDGEYNACLNFNHDMSTGYVEGYRRGAKLLFDSLGESTSNIDFLVYPILFCYRHHIEVQLKRILNYGLFLVKKQEGIGGHDIKILWERVKGIIRQNYKGGGNIRFAEAVEYFILQIHDIDPDSTELRYNKKLDNSKSLKDIKHIDLKNSVRILEELCNALDAIYMTFQRDFETACETLDMLGYFDENGWLDWERYTQDI